MNSPFAKKAVPSKDSLLKQTIVAEMPFNKLRFAKLVVTLYTCVIIEDGKKKNDSVIESCD